MGLFGFGNNKFEQMDRESVQRTNRKCNADIRKEIEKCYNKDTGEFLTYWSSSSKISMDGRIAFAERQARLHNGKFEMEPDVKVKYDRFMNDYNEYKKQEELKKEEETHKRIEEERKKEAERLQKESEENKWLAEQRAVKESCQRVLSDANYTEISIVLEEGTVNRTLGRKEYLSVKIEAKKFDVEYSGEFSKLGPRLTFDEGHLAVKAIATILSNVDISDAETRESCLQAQFTSEGFSFTLVKCIARDNIIQIMATDKNCKGLLTFKLYTSKVYNQHTNSDMENLQCSEETIQDSAALDFDNMEGHEFERYCADILKRNDFENVSVTQGSGDQGIDIIAFKDGIKYGIQCKCYSSAIGNKAVQEVFAGKTFYQCHVGIVLTNNYFTSSAIELAQRNGVVLWDRNKLLQMVQNVQSEK